MVDFPNVSAATVRHPKPDVVFSYGTAGFRTKGVLLDSVLFRLGLLVVLRSRSQKGKIVGVMVTASHNPDEDNGVKIVDPSGDMLAASWEVYAGRIANCADGEVAAVLQEIMLNEHIDASIPAVIISGQDTRTTSPGLVAALHDGIAAVGNARCIDMGLVSTPMVHFNVKRANLGLPGDEEAYYKVFADAYRKALLGATSAVSPLVVDGANGVGALKAPKLAAALGSDASWRVINTEGRLNWQAGADHVKTKQTFPDNVDTVADRTQRFASVDGDADRVVYFYVNENGGFHLVDGDKISALIALYIKDELNVAYDAHSDMSIGVCQTAYSNGAAARYIEGELGVPVAVCLTGVKYLHHKAQDFDVGIYFESNGHGTVLFGDGYYTKLQALEHKFASDASVPQSRRDALVRLLNLPELVNQAIGDALSDILLVEAILRQKNWTIQQWDALFQDSPNRLLSTRVKDRKPFQPLANDERRLRDSPEIQAKIDALVAKYKNGRSFVRPSGTEEVVRVYAEAATQEEADTLANEVRDVVLAV
eukprot:TRINITY_DN8636_c0_g1_i2.p1 TRINITY_DN8636_c0_g1~~TRINITY_DN8636_c0_g1_i2.p1  ORF type:complete len:537 (+),score=191.36 TRINITY_DN8636_c0_g1_i2:126-1736(+)